MRTALLLLGALLLPSPALAKPPEPIAVGDFYRDQSGGFWVGKAVPRTMGHDLRQHSSLDVMDPEILKEHHLTGRRDTNLETAQRYAKMVGAKSVVLGKYRVDDEKETLHLSAKLFDIKNGKLLKEASATAPLYRPFEAQDEILAALFGKKYRAPDRSAWPQKINAEKYKPDQAYRRVDIAMTAEDPNRYRRLRDALEFHEHCYFAQVEMEVLNGKAERWAAWARRPPKQQDAELRAVFSDAKLTNSSQRRTRSMQFFGLLEEARLYSAILVLADRVYAMTWNLDEEGTAVVRANSLYWKRRAQIALKDEAAAIATGQKYVKEFPEGRYFSVIKRDTDTLSKAGDVRQTQLGKLDAKLLDLEEDLAELDLDRCQALESADLYLQAIQACEAFVAAWASNERPEIRELVYDAGLLIVESHAELGQFDQARARGEKLLSSAPTQAARGHLERKIRNFPQ